MNRTDEPTAAKLQKGQGLRGPEPAGCINSGFAPILLRVRSGNSPWIVARETYISDARHQNLLPRNAGKRVMQLSKHSKHAVGYFFSTRTAAEAKWRAMCEEIRSQNRADLGRARELREKMRKPDADGFAAAMELADLGL